MEFDSERLREYMLTGMGHAPDAVFWIDQDARFLYANQQASDWTGYTVDELLEFSVPDINPTVTVERWREIWEMIARDEVATITSIHQRKDGSKFPVEVHARRVEIEDRPLVLAFVRDLTESRAAEAQLHESQQRFQSLLDNTSAVIFMKDTDGRYLLVNQRYLNLFSLSEDEVIGKSDFDIFEEGLAQAFRDADRQVMEGKKRIEIEEMAPHEDGLHTYISTKFPIKDEKGAIYAVGGIATDITPRKRAMEQAARQAERIRSLYEVASNPGLSDDERIGVTLAVGCKLLGMQTGIVSEVEGDTYHVRNAWPAGGDASPGDEYPLEETICSLAYPSDEVVAVEEIGESEFRDHRFYRESGFEAYIGTSIDVAGSRFGTLSFCSRERREVPFDSTDRDFTQLMGRWIVVMIEATNASFREQEYAKDLERSNRELEQFAYAASHDLKEPLRMISSYADLLKRNLKDDLDEKSRVYLGYMMDGAGRMRKLIDDLLDYARLEVGRENFGPVSLKSVVDEALENLTVAIEESGARIKSGKLPQVTGDQSLLVLVIQNLIGNAIRFCTETTPEIEIRSRRIRKSRAEGAERICEISVHDNGPGIATEHHERIFKIFQRLTSEKDFPGSGIGLAICRRVIEKHGGEIWVDSDEKEGSTFSFTLKMAD